MSRFSLNKAIPGALLATGADGRTRLNTNDALFHCVPPIVAGGLSVAALNAGDGQGFDRTDVWNLGTCRSGCNGIDGSVLFQGYGGVTFSGAGGVDSTTGIANNVWMTVSNNSCVVIYQDGHGPVGSPSPNLGLYQHIHYFFRISGTTVQLVRRAWCSKASQGSISVSGHTIYYRLKPGLFT